jgi:hypothetical protein
MKVKTLSLAVALIIAVAACSPAQDIPATVQAGVAVALTAVPTATPSPTPTETPLPTATFTPTATPTSTPTPTATPQPTPTPTQLPTPTPTPVPTPTLTPPRTPTAVPPTSTPIPSPTPIPYLTYEQPLYKWYIRYPGDWTVAESTLGNVYLVRFKPPQGIALLSVAVYKNYGLTYSTQSWYQASLQVFQSQGHAILGTKSISVSGRPAFETLTQYTSGDFTFRDIRLLLVEGPNAYEVSGVSTSETWAIWRPTLESLVYTFGFS